MRETFESVGDITTGIRYQVSGVVQVSAVTGVRPDTHPA